MRKSTSGTRIFAKVPDASTRQLREWLHYTMTRIFHKLERPSADVLLNTRELFQALLPFPHGSGRVASDP